MSDFSDAVDIDHLVWMLERPTVDQPAVKKIIWDQLDSRLPKDAVSRVQFQIGQMAPAFWTGWHVHNGPGYHLVLRGRVVLERAAPDPESPTGVPRVTYGDSFQAGQAFTEPIGIPHRAGNPETAITMLGVSLFVTSPDRYPVMPVEDPVLEELHRYLGLLETAAWARAQFDIGSRLVSVYGTDR
jgi:hypothetical protein